MDSEEGKRNRIIIGQLVKTLLPLWIICLLFEMIALGAWVGSYPPKSKMLQTCLLPYLIIALLGMISVVRYGIVYLEQRIVEWLGSLKDKRWNWKKGILLFVVDFMIGLFGERFLTWMAVGSLTAEWNGRKMLWAFTIVFLLSLFLCYRRILIEKVEIAVLLIVLSVGSVYVTALPVSCGISWDDEMHFHNALLLSHMLDGRMTQADVDILDNFAYTAVKHKNYTKKENQEWIELLNADSKSDIRNVDGKIRPTMQNWVYLPAALGLAVGRALRLPYAMTFVLGKWCNLFVYAFLVYWSIRKLKSRKMVAAVVAMLPPCILMAASYSRDPWMIGFIMLGFSWFIGEIQEKEKKLNIWDMVVMLGSFVIGVAPKAVYVPLVLICLFMPKDKFQTEKQCKIFRIVVLLATVLVIATFAVPFLLSNGGAWEGMRGGSAVNAVAQTAYILHAPFQYIGILLRFLWDYAISEENRTFLTSMHYFGTTEYEFLTDLLLLFVTFTDCSKEDGNIRILTKVATLGMSLGAICLVATAMYIAFTPLKLGTILGCQHRYNLQFLFPVLCVIGIVQIKNKMRKDWYRGIVLGISSFVLLNGVWDLCISTF